MRTLFPAARLGNCLRHAINKLPGKLTSITTPVRKALRSKFHTLLHRARQRKGLRVFALGQRLRHFADHVAHSAGVANGERVRRWFQEKKEQHLQSSRQNSQLSKPIARSFLSFESKPFRLKLSRCC
jgi:hypothetical protein